MNKTFLLTVLIGYLFLPLQNIQGSDFKSKEAKQAKSQYEKVIKELEKEFSEQKEKAHEIYLENLKTARKKSLDEGDLEEAQRILTAEKSEFKESNRVICIWKRRHIGSKQAPVLLAFTNEGDIINPWGQVGTWKLKGNILSTSYVEPKAPGGSWDHVFILSKDREKFEGTNQTGGKFQGTLIFGSL